MIIPRTVIYWECIAPMLEIKEMAVFEAAIQNHRLRKHFMLIPSPYQKKRSTLSLLTLIQESCPSPYETLLDISDREDYVTLVSSDMEDWCNKRRIRLYYITIPGNYKKVDTNKSENVGFFQSIAQMIRLSCLSGISTNQTVYSPLQSPNKLRSTSPLDCSVASTILDSFDSKSWDMMNYIKHLNVVNHENPDNFVNQKLLCRMYSLESVQGVSSSKFCSDLIDRCYLNSVRCNSSSFKPCHLKKLTLSNNVQSCKFISSQKLDSIITALRSIESISTINHSFWFLFSDSHLQLMSTYWPNLKDFEIYDCRITDVGIQAFHAKSGHSFRSIKLSSCTELTPSGLLHLIQLSSKTLITLELSNMSIPEYEIIEFLPYMEKLTILSLNNVCQVSDSLLEQLAISCKSLVRLSLYMYYVNDFGKVQLITDSGIELLTQGCKNISRLYLQKCPNITDKSVNLLLQSYQDSLEEIVMNECYGINSSNTNSIRRQQIRNCRHQVRWEFT